jgi:CSLREA domain-containing protein
MMTSTGTTKTSRYYLRALALLAALAVTVSLLMVSAARPAHATEPLVVNSTGDESDTNTGDGVCQTSSGACTLRAAIEQANKTPGADVIDFDIPSTGVKTISPNSLLPEITEQVIIDGYSQPGASPNTLDKGTNAKPLIELNGTNSSPPSAGSGLSVEASNTVIKRLVIDRFPDIDGIGIFPDKLGDAVTNVRIEGNFIGTDPSGTIDRGNGDNGVFIFSASDNTVGGDSPDKRNLLSGNGFAGVFIEGDSSFGAAPNNAVEGNLIGTQKDGVKALGNSTDGVAVGAFGGIATGNRVLSNSIFSNKELGIDLEDDGPTANDVGDADPGGNNRQNFPVLDSAKTGTQGTTVQGRLPNTTPNATFTVQLFSNPKGTDQGKTLIGETSVSTNSSGNASFTFTSTQKVDGKGANITATATDAGGNTSEFSAPKKVTRA